MIREDQRTVQPLEEGLKEIGLDPQKTLGEMHRTTKLVEARLGVGNGGGLPSYLQPRQPGQAPAETPTSDGPSGEPVDEAFKAVRVKVKTAGEKLKSKLARKKQGLGKLRRKSKMYYKKFKRKIAKRAAKKLAKFGRAGLEKLHKMKKRITMSSQPDESPLAGLREDLNSLGGEQHADDRSNPFEEAAFNAGLLASHLGEMFEAFGDEQSAETMYAISDQAADLSESLDALGEEDELDEDQSACLNRILEGVIKAMRMYEEMGAPSLDQILDFKAEEAEAEGEGAGGESAAA